MTCKKHNLPPLSFSVTFGGTGDDAGNSVQQTSDGGYVIVGSTTSFGAGSLDVWLVKADSDGNKVWDRTFGGSGYDVGYSVQQTTDGGYIVAGLTNSYGAGNYDVWLIKTDASGNKVWDKTYGGTDYDEGYSVQQTSDGGFVVAGATSSYGAGNSDGWLIKTDSNGDKTWDKTFGGSVRDEVRSVQPTSDGGYIMTGLSESYGGEFADLWLVKADSQGNKVWDKAFGGMGGGSGSSVQQTSDGGYVVAGTTSSFTSGVPVVWLVRTDASGNEVWDKTFGGSRPNWGSSVQQTSDGGYIIAGVTDSYGAGADDVWLVKTDASGRRVWDKTFGGTGSEGGNSVHQTSDGGYIITGLTNSQGAGDYDVWLIKTDANGN
jgi:hypothetical protein